MAIIPFSDTIYLFNTDGSYAFETNSSGLLHGDLDGENDFDIGEKLIYPEFAYIGFVEITGSKYPVYNDGIGPVLLVPDGTALPTSFPDNINDSLIEAGFPYCFASGTTILRGTKTPTTIESLCIGDDIVTTDGYTAKILWIGKQRMDTRFGTAERLQPIRISAGALGDNVPNEDLTVSNDHALLVDGILANAGALVNGTSIFRVPLDEFEDGIIDYYHIETEKHEIILANNTPAETFIDNVSRQSFDNYQEYVDLYGEEREMDELPLPRAMSPRQLPKSIKQRLAERAIALGYAEEAVA